MKEAQMEGPVDLSVDLEVGPAKEVRVLLEDERRKLVRITLRGGEILREHRAMHPITVQVLAGRGQMRIGTESAPTQAGQLWPISAGVLHEVTAEPAISLLVSFFRPGA